MYVDLAEDGRCFLTPTHSMEGRQVGVPLHGRTITANLTGMADSRYLTLEEAAAYLRISPRFLRSETVANQVTAARVGKRLLFVVEDLDDYVRARRPGRVDDPPSSTD